jgi:hypothetical protein
MIDLKKYEFWFIVGSQDLYGKETLKQVAANAAVMVRALSPGCIPYATYGKKMGKIKITPCLWFGLLHVNPILGGSVSQG